MLESNQGDTVRQIERENIIFYKRRPQLKNNFKSMTDDQDKQSATSLKASSNPPLPELQKQKRKLVIKPFISLQTRHGPPIVEKEVRQHENILLKQRNNLLSSENLKLKTKITVLEKQNQRLQKSLESENSSGKPGTSYSNNRDKIKTADTTLRAMIRGLRKEIEDLKKQNLNIKSTVKFTSLKELQVQRDQLAEQTIRLRLTLQEQQARKTTMKSNAQGVSHLEHRIQALLDKNAALLKQLSQATEKCKKLEETASKAQRALENDKKNTKALQIALLQIRSKDKQIDQLKGQLKTTHSIPSSTLLQQTPKQNKFQLRRPSLERNNPKISSATSSKNSSLQKNQNTSECQKCKKYENQNKALLQKIQKLESQIQKAKGSFGQLPKGPIAEVKPQEVQQLRRFLLLRFKAHRLTYDQSQKYLINCQGAMNQPQLNKIMTVRELIESLLVEPFCIVSNRYLQVIIWKLAFSATKEAVSIDDNKQVKKSTVIQAYRNFLTKYEIFSQQKEQEMFIQVAELITTYYQQILAALTTKRNGEGTIAQKAFLQFFKQIQLQPEYIDFIITQIILESLDMQHLNFFAMFQIFYMPQMAEKQPQNSIKKKKFQVQHQRIVQQEDQEFQESKSHIASRNKTLENREKQEDDQEQYQQWSKQDAKKVDLFETQHLQIIKQKKDHKDVKNQKLQQQYVEQFQQQAQKEVKQQLQQ